MIFCEPTACAFGRSIAVRLFLCESSVLDPIRRMLDQQLRRLEQDFLEEGGLRERITRARLAARRRNGPK
jgi:four helix bundle suffix protein